MLTRLLDPADPFDGRGAHRRQLRLRVESVVAFALAVTACGLVTAAWIETLAPAVTRSLGL